MLSSPFLSPSVSLLLTDCYFNNCCSALTLSMQPATSLPSRSPRILFPCSVSPQFPTHPLVYLTRSHCLRIGYSFPNQHATDYRPSSRKLLPHFPQQSPEVPLYLLPHLPMSQIPPRCTAPPPPALAPWREVSQQVASIRGGTCEKVLEFFLPGRHQPSSPVIYVSNVIGPPEEPSFRKHEASTSGVLLQDLHGNVVHVISPQHPKVTRTRLCRNSISDAPTATCYSTHTNSCRGRSHLSWIKTCNLISECICWRNSMNDLWFENVYLYSESLQQPKYQHLAQILWAVDGLGYFPCTDNETVVSQSLALPNSIFIFDDEACEKQLCIQEYFCIGRHVEVDLFYVCQTYSSIPKQLLHGNANVAVLFRIDYLNLRHIYSDHVNTDMTFEKFKELFACCWSDRHGFLTIVKDPPLLKGRYRGGFDQFIIVCQ
ncbi:hypothetical protein PR048_024572 [Dryococelus australis]|uniref:Uncharacterized protein n=1 Tax=Dryococelus australis TaxID=614101 RepID=A0ABQ9GNX9_9NEOP|nr:hypothetical protein PR048_024572 [Dryococelus australis]